ncbi:GntR family transcriptional regulator [Hephaestia sp. CMS5P-6]|nr:GntR family transcriptional regulator [Hephaestia mangrovi]
MWCAVGGISRATRWRRAIGRRSRGWPVREAARAAGRSLEAHIRSVIEDRIMSGAWHPGDRVPAEHELMVEFDCSRMTVNRALSALADAGFVERRRRAGTVVARPRRQMAAIEIPDIEAQVEAAGARYRLETLSVDRIDGAAAPAVARLEGAAEVLAIVCRHHGDGVFALEERWINLDAVPRAAGVDFGRVAPGRWLLDYVPWTEGDYRIAAVAADPRLTVPADTPCLSFERWTSRGGQTITYVRQVFPGGFALTAGGSG